MKVLFVNTRYKPQGQAGPAFSVQYLAEQLVREGDSAVVLCWNAEKGLATEHIDGVLVHRFPPGLPARQFEYRFRGILEAERPDVVHTNMLKSFPVGLLGPLVKGAGARLVHTVREYCFICDRGTLFNKEKVRRCDEICPECRRERPGIRRFIDHLDAVVGVSRFTLERHLQEGVFVNVPIKSVIFNGYATDAKPGVRPDGGMRAFRLGFMGRVGLDKGIEVLFRECASMPPDLRYTIEIAGKCPPRLRALLNRHYPDIPARFLGFVPQERLLANIDVLVVPSIWHEPLGRVVLEAYAFGVPVIATRLGGTPEIVDDGETGIVVDPLKRGELREAILALANDPERLTGMGKKAFAKSADFLPERILSDYRRVYESKQSVM